MLYNWRSYETFRRNIIHRKDQILNTLGVKLEWSPQADKDMKGIYDYIKNNLNEPEIAMKIAKKILYLLYILWRKEYNLHIENSTWKTKLE